MDNQSPESNMKRTDVFIFLLRSNRREGTHTHSHTSCDTHFVSWANSRKSQVVFGSIWRSRRLWPWPVFVGQWPTPCPSSLVTERKVRLQARSSSRSHKVTQASPWWSMDVPKVNEWKNETDASSRSKLDVNWKKRQKNLYLFRVIHRQFRLKTQTESTNAQMFDL